MSRPVRIILAAFAISAGLFAVCVMAAGVWAYRAGVAVISVHEKKDGDTRVHLPVPMIIVDVATLLTPRDRLPQLPPEAANVQPVIGNILRELASCPDAVLVEVETPEEHVVIAKRDGRFEIEVVNVDTEVSISLPARSLRTIARIVEKTPVRKESWERAAKDS